MLRDFPSTIMDISSEQEAPKAPTFMDFDNGQFQEAFYQQAAKQIGKFGMDFSLNKNGIVARRALIDGGLQELVQQ